MNFAQMLIEWEMGTLSVDDNAKLLQRMRNLESLFMAMKAQRVYDKSPKDKWDAHTSNLLEAVTEAAFEVLERGDQ